METWKCLQKALDYIEEHLEEKLTLEDVADVANYSPWHFHRLFKAYVGKGVGEYIRLRKLSKASAELVFTTRPIVDIASKYTFESQAAFTRAYQSCFGVTPGKVRRKLKTVHSFLPVRLEHTKTIRKGEQLMKTRITERDEFTVVGMDCFCSQNNNTIPQLWEKFNKYMNVIPNMKECKAALGICVSDVEHVTPDTEFRYIASMEVEKVDELPEGMVAYTVPGGTYLVLEHVGALDTLPQSYDYAYKTWFSENEEYGPTGFHDFEVYDERFKFGQEDSIMEIWIPIKKK